MCCDPTVAIRYINKYTLKLIDTLTVPYLIDSKKCILISFTKNRSVNKALLKRFLLYFYLRFAFKFLHQQVRNVSHYYKQNIFHNSNKGNAELYISVLNIEF